MTIDGQRFALPVGKREGEVCEVERRIIAVDGAMVIRTYKHHVLNFVISATRQPLYVMTMAQPVAVALARIIEADLTSTLI